MEKKKIFILAFIASLAALLSIVYIGFGIPVPDSIVSLQPTDTALPVVEFLKPINEAPELMLRFFTADSFLILSGILLYLGMYSIVAERSRLVAGVGLGIGLLTILLDCSENAFFISYAQQSIRGVHLAPALSLIYIIAHLKAMGSYGGFLIFGLAWPRETKLDWTLSSLMVLYSITGVLSLVIPGVLFVRGIILLFCMAFFAFYFAMCLRTTKKHSV